MRKYVNFRNTGILLFFLLNAFVILFPNLHLQYGLKDVTGEEFYSYASEYLRLTGQRQNWRIFSPPPQYETHVLLRGYAENFSVDYTPEYQTSRTRINHEPHRKSHVNLIGEKNSAFRNRYLKYWCKKLNAEHSMNFTNATVYYYRKNISGPGSIDITESYYVNEWSVKC